MNPNPRVVFLVVGTLALAVLIYCITLSACALLGIKPDTKVIEYLKDIGLLCAGAIAGILSRTGNQTGTPQVEVINTPTNPVETHAQ